MLISTVVHNDLLVVTVSEMMSLDPEDALKNEIESALAAGIKMAIIDLSGVTRFDSGGMAHVVGSHQLLLSHNIKSCWFVPAGSRARTALTQFGAIPSKPNESVEGIPSAYSLAEAISKVSKTT